MPHPTKKQRLEGHQRNDVMAAGINSVASFDDLADVLANILGFLLLEDIMSSRRINKTTMEAVRKTIVPLTEFRVDRVIKYHAMTVMTRAIPNLQQIELRRFGSGYEHKWSVGEDPRSEREAETAHMIPLDIEIISNFSKLRSLTINSAPLNGRYPFLFNSFPLLQKLSISCCHYLKWDLEMLDGFPLLKELECYNGLTSNACVTGNISSLRAIKDTLKKVKIICSCGVEGNFMDLADFPHLKELDLNDTAVTGDIRDIGDNDFSSLEHLKLPDGVYGGVGYELQRISDGPDLMRTLHLFNKQRPNVKLHNTYWILSENSPDWYAGEDGDDDSPPFNISLVKAGPRVGYRWETDNGDPSEVNWLDPEPGRETCDYGKYFKELCNIDGKVKLYRGFHQPPTEEEYHRLVDDHAAREESGSESDESDEGYSSEEW